MDSAPGCHAHRAKRSHQQMEDEGFGAPRWAFDLAIPRNRDYSNGVSPHPHTSRQPLPNFSHHVSPDLHSAPPESRSPTAHPSHDSASASGSDHMPAVGPQMRRFRGDGFDYRRPMGLTIRNSPGPSVGSANNNVIDLTELDSDDYATPVDLAELEVVDARPAREREQSQAQAVPRAQRPPRFAREIMLRDGVSPGDHQSPILIVPDSPEILDARTVPQVRGAPILVEDGVEGEDEIQIVGENRRNPPPPPRARPMRIDTPERVFRSMAERFRRDERHFQQFRAHTHRHRQNNPAPRPRATALNHLADFIGLMNYQDVGFDLGLGGVEREREPPAPTFDKPVPVPEGFTRSPKENDTVVCPNCGDELCTGESEQKKQVWIVKACGHAYCGQCTANRHVKKSAKGKEKAPSAPTKPFKTCVVEACDKKVSNQKAMIQVFL